MPGSSLQKSYKHENSSMGYFGPCLLRVLSMKKHILIIWLWGFLTACASDDQIILVSDQEAYRQAVKHAKPGDTIALKNGEWTDFEILLEGKGLEGKPITLTAEEKGKVILTGNSNLRLAGEYLLVSGLVFKDGYTLRDSVISFRKNKQQLANNSRVTEVVIDNFNNPERYENDYWVTLYGKNNRFDHSHLEGKKNKGVTFAVRLNSAASLENHHLIDHNYFGPRSILGANGGETLRIGTSHYSLSNSFTQVENNYFDRCDGELEIISVKSGGNVLKNNIFYQSRGTLTLRHGNGNLIENNVFQGNGLDHTGGIRVINKDQIIRNNYMEGLAGYRFGGALVVMNGVPDSPVNRYHQVDNALIENNSIINSGHIQLAAGSDKERTANPINSNFNNNLIVTTGDHDIFTVYDDVSGISFNNNMMIGDSEFAQSQQFKKIDTETILAANGLRYLPKTAEGEYSSAGISNDLVVISKEDTGVSWYPKPGQQSVFNVGKTIKVTPEEGVLMKAVAMASAGDRLELMSGHYKVAKTLIIDKPLSIVAAESVEDKGSQNKVSISFERSALFEIIDAGSLQLQGLHISGIDSPDSTGNSLIRTSRYSMLENYRLEIIDSVISDLDTNHSFHVLRVAKSTFADAITIRNSQFNNINGYVLALDQELDDDGRYNAEYVDIIDSSFVDVKGAILSFYRGGTDESTFGPHLTMTGSKITNSGFSKRNKAGGSILLHGVQVAAIEKNTFQNSHLIKIHHTVGEPRTRIEANRFIDTAEPIVVELNSHKTNTAIIGSNQFLTTKAGVSGE